MKYSLSRELRAFACAIAICAFGPSMAWAQDTDILSEQDSTVSSDARSMAGFRRGSVRASLDAMLSARGMDARTLASLSETANFTDGQGRRFARYEQKIDGLRVYGAYVKAAFDSAGTPIHLIERLAQAGPARARPSIGEAAALRVALATNFPGQSAPPALSVEGAVTKFADTDFFAQGPSVERVIIARGRSHEEGFLVETWSQADNQLYYTLVNGFGRVVSNELRTAADSYNVFAVDPSRSAQAVVNGPPIGNTQSPNGWLGTGTQTTINISGNNVRAYLDRDNNNAADAGGSVVTSGNFLTAANLTQAPTTLSNQSVAVQNLFYLSNVIHDRLYIHGFVENQGNFQENNFGRGGLGLDSVQAEAQDGGSTNNANFATPADGSRPRMQMYLWTNTNPQRDGDVDSDVVYHEYGHGLSTRMIGGLSGDIGGAIGEGASDVLAILINNNDVVGEYSTNNVNGIRSAPYANHPDTLASFNRARGVHRNGELFAATIWDVWELYQANALSVNTLLTDFVGGMNFTPSSPTYITMRDGLLAQTPASRDCLVWRAFASRGMGVGASISRTNFRVVQSFTVPSGC